ncbi:hypothetical protein K438DRAFT_2070439 [Mycena galopus ATCC 62051]|nr:hypothetical protein K438DRAFT_2070439 [Mycena galopus ATCC 62051]
MIVTSHKVPGLCLLDLSFPRRCHAVQLEHSVSNKMPDQFVASLEPIAIVGISVEIPSGTTDHNNLNHDSFFKFLLEKGQSYEPFPPDRFKNALSKGPGLGQVVTDVGSFLKDFADFDPIEFGIPSKDARAMAVSTRKLIETSFLALLDSGINYRGRNVGCYMSAVSFDSTTIGHADEYEPRGSFAGYPYMVANKVSYYLDLLGPSIPVDTACSSTLTALHLAVQALRTGDCESAIVGGCQLNHRSLDFIQYSQGSVLSPDGKCKPFDISANGFSRGEGVGAVVLKPLADALRDGDHVYASILGTGINSAGAAAPVSAPVAVAQMDAMRRAFAGTGRFPSEVDYIELHATGTAAGDPTETNWVGSVFGGRADELLIGSVKGNIGHLEIVSFLASLSKVCSIFQSGIIPPTVNLNTPNPAIRWAEHRMRAPIDCTPLNPRHASGRALVSISSSGIGGSNGHVVVEGPPTCFTSPEATSPFEFPVLLIAGGLSPQSTEANRDALIAFISDTPAPLLPTISTTYGRRARQMTWRSASVCSGNTEGISFSPPRLTPRNKQPLVLVFSGQGPQHFQMGRQLFKQYSTFRESIERMDGVYKAATGLSLMAETGLFADNPTAQPLPEIWPIIFTFPALCMLQMALVDLFASFGIVPDIVVGHSAGETAMTYASGAASQTMALQLSIARGAALSACEGTGTMAAMSCNSETAGLLLREVLDEHPDAILEISCYNSPEAVTLSGSRIGIEQAVALATKRGIFARTLHTHLPAHCSLVESCQSDYQARLHEIFEAHPGEHRPKIRTYSSFTGKRWDEPFSADYFWWNTRNPVRFSDAMSALLQDTPDATFIEVGPHPVLGSYISFGSSSRTVIASMRRTKTPEDFHEVRTLLSAIGELVTTGYNLVDFHSLNGTSSADRISTPSYPFSKKTFPYHSESNEFITHRTRKPSGPLNDLNLGLNSLTHPMLAQHVITNEPIMPATGYLEMAFEFGARYLWNIKFLNIMPLLPDRILRVQVAANGHRWSVGSWPSILEGTDTGNPPRIHAEGYMSEKVVAGNYEELDLNQIRNRSQILDLTGFYQRMQYFAQYGRVYQRVTGCYVADSGGLIRIRSSEDDLVDAGKYHFHPVVLDACLHALVHPVFTRNEDNTVYYLPAFVETLALHRSFVNQGLPPTVYTYATMRKWAPESITWDVAITDEAGLRICTLNGLRVDLHQLHDAAPITISSLPVFSRDHITSDHTCDVPPLPDLAVIEFDPKQMLQYQPLIRRVESVPGCVLWIYATADAQNGAALGFSRSLRRELHAAKVNLVVFDPIWTPQGQLRVIQELSKIPGIEPEVFITDHGRIHVPRLIHRAFADDNRCLDLEKPWIVTRNNVLQCPPSPLPPNYVLVRVTNLSPPSAGLRGFSGVVVNSASAIWSKDASVIGVVDDQISNYVLVHEGRVTAACDDAPLYAALAVPLVILAVTVGIEAIRMPARLTGRSFLITNCETPMGRCLATLLRNMDVASATTSENPCDMKPASVGQHEFILSGYSADDDVQLLQSKIHADAITTWWTRSLTHEMEKNPWLAGDALSLGKYLAFKDLQNVDMVCRPPTEHISLLPNIQTSISLFDAEKSYLLLGGIGSLGLHIALWMYQNGAREIILSSRSGEASLARARNIPAMRLVNYLRSIAELNIRLVECDAASPSATSALINTFTFPIAGCILLAASFSDRVFSAHTEDSFSPSFAPKEGSFRALEQAVSIKTLDFVIALSSVTGLFGSAGQSNYSAANTALEGLLRPYPNAFSMVAPAILGSVHLTSQSNLSHNTRYKTWTAWGMPARQLCDALKDSLLSLYNGNSDQLYIPEFDWDEIKVRLGPSPMFDHLLRGQTESAPAAEASSTASSIRQMVLTVLEVDEGDFSPEVPLTSFGLDSLSAGRLSFMLKPHLAVTQLQLLADMTFNDLCGRIASMVEVRVDDGETQAKFDWHALHQPGQTVVRLVEGEGTPLILLHGANGDIITFMALQERFTSALWAIQTTPETPMDSVEAMAGFYFEQIKSAQPVGPYRIGGFSGSSLLTFHLARYFENNGDHIVQFVIVDHFPMMFVSPIFCLDAETVATREASKMLIRQALLPLLDIYSAEKQQERRKVADELMDAFNGLPVRDYIKSYYAAFVKIVGMAALFLVEGLGDHAGNEGREQALKTWLRQLKAPLTHIVARQGIRRALADHPEWEDLGCRACFENAKVLLVDAGHFDIFEADEVVEQLQHGW